MQFCHQSVQNTKSGLVFHFEIINYQKLATYYQRNPLHPRISFPNKIFWGSIINNKNSWMASTIDYCKRNLISDIYYCQTGQTLSYFNYYMNYTRLHSSILSWLRFKWVQNLNLIPIEINPPCSSAPNRKFINMSSLWKCCHQIMLHGFQLACWSEDLWKADLQSIISSTWLFKSNIFPHLRPFC